MKKLICLRLARVMAATLLISCVGQQNIAGQHQKGRGEQIRYLWVSAV